MYGPIDYIVVGFPGNKFNGEIMPELNKLINSGLINIVDLQFVVKDPEGNVAMLEINEMPPEFSEVLEPLGDSFKSLLSQSDIDEVGSMLENNSSAGILVLEHVWAKGLKDAILKSGGQLIADGRIHDEDLKAALEDLK